MAIEEHDDEDEDIDEEEENEEEETIEREEEEEDYDGRRHAGPSHSVAKSGQKCRTRTLMGSAHIRTEEGVAEEEEEEQEEEEVEEEEEAVRPCQWDSQRDLHKVSLWHRRAHRQ